MAYCTFLKRRITKISYEYDEFSNMLIKAAPFDFSTFNIHWVVCIRISICLYYIFVFFYLIEIMYFYLSLIQVKAFANSLCI
jgi:hypothetical protein